MSTDEWNALDRFFWEWNEYRKLIYGFMITVINIKALKELPDGWVYVAGENRKLLLTASLLASPWTLDKESDRPIVMKKYKQHLWGELKRYDSEARLELFRLARLAKKGDLSLGCYCKPRACHGDAIKAAIEWIIEKEISEGDNIK